MHKSYITNDYFHLVQSKSKDVDVCAEDAFGKVYMAEAEGLRNFLYYKTGDLELAKDLMQDTFRRLWENCKKVTADRAKYYLYHVANNLFINQTKRQKVVLKFKERTRPRLETHIHPQHQLEEKEFEKHLNAAINALPEGQKVVFLMHRLDKMTYKQIAATLDLSVKAVEKRMQKALQQLRKMYKNV